MALRFIIGRAGSGKTHTCLHQMTSALQQSAIGKPLILLVPEQATFQAELALCSVPGIGGTIRAQVLSFRRLAHRVLSEVGGGSRRHIGELGKRMLLRRFLDARRPELTAFNRVPGVPGFLDSLAGAISEFKTYLITPDILKNAAATVRSSGDRRLADKMSDLALLYSDLQDYLDDRFTDPDDYLTLLAESIPASSLIKDSMIWIDGFSGFTPQEYEVLRTLMVCSEQVNVALCLDGPASPAKHASHDVFHVTRETYQKLSRMASEAAVGIMEPLYPGRETLPRFNASPALTHLERSFCGQMVEPFPEEPRMLSLNAAADRRTELEAVAREIIHLCRDQGYRFREISIVTRQLEMYRDQIEEVFADYSIPFFIDVKRSVMHHPVIELIRSALDTVISGWSYDPVFRYLKTDLAPVDRESVDLLENYVLAYGIHGSRWTDDADWTFRPRRLKEGAEEIPEDELGYLHSINRIRRTAIEKLAAFEKEIASTTDAAGITQSLVEMLLRLDIPGKLDQWSRKAQDEGEPEAALEYAQLWNGILSLFDELVESLGGESCSLAEYSRVLEAGLDGLRLALVPPAMDQVLVSSLERSRNPNVRAAFVIGVNDGIFPARQPETGLFSDLERRRLVHAGMELAPGIWERYLEEQFLVYIGFTRASEYLWVSYVLADDEGAALNPSVLIAHIQNVFPYLQETVFTAEPGGPLQNDLHYVAHRAMVMPYLATRLREFRKGEAVNPIWWDVYNYVLTHPATALKATALAQSLFFENRDQALTSEQALSVYGDPPRVSVSRIEKLNSCPFAHFCNYGLRLRQRQVYKLEPPGVGEFIHAALKHFVDRVRMSAADWSTLTNEECTKMAADIVDQLTPALQNEILLSSARYRHLGLKMQKTVERAALVLTEHARQGRFRPVGLELAFGHGETLAAPPVLIGDKEIHLVGRIDRLDSVQEEGVAYLRVIDYKSGRSKPDLPSIYHGLQIQLLAYLDIALSCSRQLVGTEAEPAGMLYFRAYDPFVSAAGPIEENEIEVKLMESLKMTGLLVADQEIIRLMDRTMGAGQHSRLLPVSFTKAGSFTAGSSVVSRDQINALRRHLHELIRDAGERILGGSVAIQPTLLGNAYACRFCEFRPVCQFDPLFKGNGIRHLVRYGPDEIWNRIRTGEGDG